VYLFSEKKIEQHIGMGNSQKAATLYNPPELRIKFMLFFRRKISNDVERQHSVQRI
jgi:hypothetical protein